MQADVVAQTIKELLALRDAAAAPDAPLILKNARAALTRVINLLHDSEDGVTGK